ncbi:MAG: tRNA uridine-5-carboxymethylaminomethyl(34) synthesis GTPase MnmE [Thermoanaerobaculia bacterium]
MIELDTIVAPATPPGRSALAIVRIDGPGSNAILTAFMRATLPAKRTATLVRLNDIDECIVVRYEAPHSFTGNDLIELTLHGNPLLVERVIEACTALGARMAEPGEFTERAVLNGKLDLVQAESIADLINARTTLQAKLSLSNLEGMLSRKAAAIRQTLLDVISRLEAALDFSEEGYEFITRDEARAKIDAALRDIEAMRETYRRGRATRAGLNAVILGRPNAGKSTLLNRLVGSDRAIVTPIPGTTRDIVRETIEIGGLPVTLADTAGLRASEDVVEGIGVERAREAARTAEIVLYLVDGVVGLTAEDEKELETLENVEVVFTKTDLARRGGLSISAVSDEGIDLLLRRLDELVRERFVAPEGALVNERQRLAVAECGEALTAARGALDSGLDEQMIVADLYRAANALGVLTGAITREDVLSEIFGKFCIGK